MLSASREVQEIRLDRKDYEGLCKYFGPGSRMREEPFKGLRMEVMIILAF